MQDVWLHLLYMHATCATPSHSTRCAIHIEESISGGEDLYKSRVVFIDKWAQWALSSTGLTKEEQVRVSRGNTTYVYLSSS